jgi:phosphatidylethanolamine-binding protein (PEBP) family uncharacterized protein
LGLGLKISPSGTHRHFFKVYAFDGALDLDPNPKKKDVEKDV